MVMARAGIGVLQAGMCLLLKIDSHGARARFSCLRSVNHEFQPRKAMYDLFMSFILFVMYV